MLPVKKEGRSVGTLVKLHIVVHHRQDSHQPWSNSWLDDSRLEAITTTAEIGRLCEQAMEENRPVFVHRCGWGSSDPRVCCSVSVENSAPLDQQTSLVKFSSQQVLNAVPTVSPRAGQNYYWA